MQYCLVGAAFLEHVPPVSQGEGHPGAVSTHSPLQLGGVGGWVKVIDVLLVHLEGSNRAGGGGPRESIGNRVRLRTSLRCVRRTMFWCGRKTLMLRDQGEGGCRRLMIKTVQPTVGCVVQADDGLQDVVNATYGTTDAERCKKGARMRGYHPHHHPGQGAKREGKGEEVGVRGAGGKKRSR